MPPSPVPLPRLAAVVAAVGLGLLVMLLLLLRPGVGRRVERRATDGLTVARVETEYLLRGGQGLHHVKVSARNGVVTLTGSAPDAATRRQAVALAKRSGAVTAVINLVALPTGRTAR